MSDQPQAMTLEEAAKLIADTPSDLGPLSLARVQHGWSVLTWFGASTAAYDLNGDVHAQWWDAASQALGRPVVERDPAAELAEALKDMLNLDWEQYILSDRVPERREAANEVVESAEAALAAYEASRK